MSPLKVLQDDARVVASAAELMVAVAWLHWFWAVEEPVSLPSLRNRVEAICWREIIPETAPRTATAGTKYFANMLTELLGG